MNSGIAYLVCLYEEFSTTITSSFTCHLIIKPHLKHCKFKPFLYLYQPTLVYEGGLIFNTSSNLKHIVRPGLEQMNVHLTHLMQGNKCL